MPADKRLFNYIGNQWREPSGEPGKDILDPATQDVLAGFQSSSQRDIANAVVCAQDAWSGWRNTPALERIKPLSKLLSLMQENKANLAEIITKECGKTLGESLGELQRAFENIEVACGIPFLSQGLFSEDVSEGIDEIMIRQPVGISLIICPFNFPAMIAFWFLPYAVACGNPVIVKPSERVPLTMQAIFKLVDQCGFPAGVVQLIQGDANTSESLLKHPDISTVSFVGSTPVAKKVYTLASQHGKRAQCHGGAKNPIVVMPDADPEMTLKILADSAFGCAGQRCLAASLVLPVGEAEAWLRPSLVKLAEERIVGYGLDKEVEMGPVISPESLQRIENIIAQSEAEGARILLDGRNATIPGFESGNFIKPCLIDKLSPESKLISTEIFGPVLGILPMQTFDEAIAWINKRSYGNMASIFTASGNSARQFRHDVLAGNIGINIGVAAPMAFFPFSGWKESFFGDLHGQAMDAVEFFTQKKVVIERWPKAWQRKF